MTDFISIIDDILIEQLRCENMKCALKCMHDNLYLKIKPMLSSTIFPINAFEYRQQRDACNVELFKLLNCTLDLLNSLFKNTNGMHIKPMSSICAKLNLINDSDVDIGILICGLNLECGNVDCVKYERVSDVLEEHGFVYSHVFNADVPNNRYFSYCKIVNGVEIEVKIRDYASSFSILQLHEWLDTQLTDDEITLFTYAKYVLKQYDNEHNTKYYSNFKKILYETGFYCIGGSFLL